MIDSEEMVSEKPRTAHYEKITSIDSLNFRYLEVIDELNTMYREQKSNIAEPNMDHDKIKRLRNAIFSGNYTITSQDIAEKMVVL